MTAGRAVAFDAAETTEIEAKAPPKVGKVPVWRSLGAGWAFFLRRPRSILARLAPAVIIAALILQSIVASAGGTPTLDIVVGRMLPMMLLYLAFLLIVQATFYAFALGKQERLSFPGLTIGPDELRFLFVNLIAVVIIAVTLAGAWLVGREIARTVAFISRDVIQLSTVNVSTDIQWFKDLPLLAQCLLLGPVVIAGLILIWFSLRYSFVPLHVIAVRRLAIFDAMALTKRNTWRLLILTALLYVSLVLFQGVVTGLLRTLPGWGAFGHMPWLYRQIAEFVPQAMAAGSPHAGLLSLQYIPPPPGWVTTVLNAVFLFITLVVNTGAMAYAYKSVVKASADQ